MTKTKYELHEQQIIIAIYLFCKIIKLRPIKSIGTELLILRNEEFGLYLQ